MPDNRHVKARPWLPKICLPVYTRHRSQHKFIIDVPIDVVFGTSSLMICELRYKQEGDVTFLLTTVQ